jgi:outer membrane biosynthesis protein TonB
MRWALAIAVVLVAAPAAAEPDYPGQLYRWLYPPKASPTVPIPVPAPQAKAKPEAAPVRPIESPKVQPRSVERKPKPRPKPKVEQAPISGGGQALPPRSGITCSEARQGVGMPCFLIRANAYQYERLSSAEKAKANSCLSASERAAIAACFR